MTNAITQAREAVNEAGLDSSLLSVARNNLAILLSDRYSHADDMKDLEEAIRGARLALRDGGLDRAAHVYKLSAMLRKKFAWAKTREDLNEALIFSKQSVDITPLGHRERARRLSNHAFCLVESLETESLEMTTSLEDLDEAIDNCHEAVRQAPALQQGYVDRSVALGALSTTLSTRFEQRGALEDLKDAIYYSQIAKDEMERDNMHDAQQLNTFANTMGRRYSRTGDLQDIDRATDAARRAVDAEPPGHANRTRSSVNLATW
ncbi:hypothetical protein LTR08_000467 [Meristemomyces frigidus]|nr:hypothetical protein LTR08_000467 [Meristemomyces frigidus]